MGRWGKKEHDLITHVNKTIWHAKSTTYRDIRVANDNQNNDFRLLVEIIRTIRKESGCAHDVYKIVTSNNLSDGLHGSRMQGRYHLGSNFPHFLKTAAMIETVELTRFELTDAV